MASALDLNPVIVLADGSGYRIVDARMKVGHAAHPVLQSPRGCPTGDASATA